MIEPISLGSIATAGVVGKSLAAAIGKKALVDGGTAAGLRVAGNLLTKATRAVQEGQSVRSLSDYSRPARVEPLVIVEDSLKDIAAMPDVMKSISSIFIGYYLQAAVFTGTKIGKIEPLKVFDQLNPDRSRSNGLQTARDLVWSNEAFSEGLPSMEDFNDSSVPDNLVVSIEKNTDEEKENLPNKSTSVGDVDKYFEASNLVVGKMMNIELRDGDHSGKFPIMFRLVPTTVKSGVITHIFTSSSKDNSMKEQVHLWKAGQISFWRDLVFQTHLIDEHRKVLMNDTSNVYKMITDRRRNNMAASVSSKRPSMADASNILVVSKETSREIGRSLYGKIESVSVRKKLFDSTYLLLLVVVDELHERITIYHRGYDKPTTASFNDVKSSEKNKGPDVTEILKAYIAGATPNMI